VAAVAAGPVAGLAWTTGARALAALAASLRTVQSGAVDEAALAGELLRAAAAAPRLKALVVGVNYERTEAQLQGCIHDAHRNKALLTRRFGVASTPESLRLLTDEPNGMPPTCHNIRKGIRWLLEVGRLNANLTTGLTPYVTDIQRTNTKGSTFVGYQSCIRLSCWKCETCSTDPNREQPVFYIEKPIGVVVTA
jgi:hypothetical protein